ncbi:uncharacterized protein LOC112568615 [Pomacea canaliculata]|uniref:uncharacterized protein LOC112568615 n=1 Tax=Pomacea canaliculata TaxID=400727 RepID=UPI000D739C9D|nr:uncharacterized protein LOC112568615 [Pomacea canaliculata]
MLTMYHYTNRQGLDAIKKRGYISESNDAARDTSFGFGVYMTHLSPAYDKIKVAKNCWDKGYESAIKQGKLDYAIRIEIPAQELDCFRHGERVVFLYHGQLVLRHYRHEFITCNRGNDNNGAIGLGVATGIVGAIALLGVAAVSAMK